MTAKPHLTVDDTTRKAVADASNPKASAWVSANAGSGKTFVLARRVVRLLLAGTDPGRILCLTFTKAAAAEMAKRVFDTLSKWATLSDAKLAEELADIEGAPADTDRLAVARRLFARALETPGGLKIQTIHAFCERLLHQFPFEANVPGHFEVLEERDAAALQIEARRRVVAGAARHDGGRLGRALATILAYVSDFTYEEALTEFIASRDRVRAWTASAGGLDRALGDLRVALGLGESDSATTLRRTILAESCFDEAAIRRLADLLQQSGRENDRKAALRLAPCLADVSEKERLDAWIDLFTTANGEMRSANSLVTASVKNAWPGLGDMIVAESGRLTALLDRIAAAECFETSEAMLRLATAAVAEYERLKAGRGALDFEDLIVQTVRLLSKTDASRWVQYKLDRGLDHILVDEAQDTSPRQWQVIRALVEDFFSGAGASEAVRTLFAVGDEKQSIFSFQGAVPAWFSLMQRELGTRARAAGYAFADVALHLSFRSTATVLSAVDKVFDAPHARDGVTTETAWPFHTAARRRDLGRVVVWPLVLPPVRPEPDDWATPLDHLDQKSPEVVLAERIATTIGGWLRTGEAIEATGKPIRPGGILILTRTRGAQTDAINRALKSRGIPIAGADRLQLHEHIAVMDLMALGRVMLLPEDDLSLAALLKSPLIGLSEDDLFRAAHGRPGSLWEALGTSEDIFLRSARTKLERWLGEADWRDPHAFYARILGPEGGRRAFLRRLGTEAEDVLDEFLAQALAYERVSTPSLQGFLAWLEAAPTEIKRDTDMLRDEVRVMTVHGAKGLEADIVFLVDVGSVPVHSGHDRKVLALTDDPDADTPAPIVWMRSRRVMPASVQAYVQRARDRAADEYRRLLYVAMTRARDRLYVCGTRKQNTDTTHGWHALVADALGPESRREEAADGTLLALEWRPRDATPAKPAAPEAPAHEKEEPPGWVSRPAPSPPVAARRLAPSAALGLGDEQGFPPEVAVARPGEAVRSAALARGRLIHRLLESLPDHPPEARRLVGARYLAAIAPDADAAMLDEILGILDDPGFAPLFSAGSRAEVEIAGRVPVAGGEAVVAGRIDRIAVTPTQVFIVDYKTNRPAPRKLEDVPAGYVAQLALYRRVLARLYPDRPVVAALLWTDIPALMEIPSRMLDGAESAMIAG